MMKRILFVVICFHLCSNIIAQNLVPNYSFEIYDTCPYAPNQVNIAAPWTNPTTASPDYFNDCNTTGLGANTNVIGGGGANTGIAYTGIDLYEATFTLRDYIEVQLISPLGAGTAYYVEFFVSLSDSCRYAVSNVGAYFSPSYVSSSSSYTLGFSPQIFNPYSNLVTDKMGWTKISGTFIAIGGEHYIIIGNFDDDLSTHDTLVGGGPYDAAYFYIDDVSVIPDSLTGIHDANLDANSISIYPNPASEEINIITTLSQNENGIIVIENVLGQVLMTRAIVAGENNLKVSVSELAPGIYIYREIINGVRTNSGKIIIER